MNENVPSEPAQSSPLTDGDDLLTLFHRYVAYRNAEINWLLKLVPPLSPDDEAKSRKMYAPVEFAAFPRLLNALGSDRASFEECWRLGFEKIQEAREKREPHPLSHLNKFKNTIIEAVSTTGHTNYSGLERRRERQNRSGDDDGHRR